MGSKALKYSAILIGTYLIVQRAASVSGLTKGVSAGGVSFVKALQGR